MFCWPEDSDTYPEVSEWFEPWSRWHPQPWKAQSNLDLFETCLLKGCSKSLVKQKCWHWRNHASFLCLQCYSRSYSVLIKAAAVWKVKNLNCRAFLPLPTLCKWKINWTQIWNLLSKKQQLCLCHYPTRVSMVRFAQCRALRQSGYETASTLMKNTSFRSFKRRR